MRNLIGVVDNIIDKYVAEVELLNSSAKVKIDQEELETVIPGLNKNNFFLIF